MRTRCPACGATVSLDALLGHDAAREALTAAFKLSGPLGGALVRYLALFRPEARELSMDRVARLLGELLPDLQAQRISRGGEIHAAPPEAWVWAIEQSLSARDAGRLVLPLRGHGWLYEVLVAWKPQPGQVVVSTAGETPPPPARPASRTLSAIAALEDRARG